MIAAQIGNATHFSESTCLIRAIARKSGSHAMSGRPARPRTATFYFARSPTKQTPQLAVGPNDGAPDGAGGAMAKSSRRPSRRDGGCTWAALASVTKIDDVAFGRPSRGSPVLTIFIAGLVAIGPGVQRLIEDARTGQHIANAQLSALSIRSL
jgi:hypothetical protein